MSLMLHKIKTLETRFDEKAAHFIMRHPILGFIVLFVLVPIFILIAVGGGTLIIWLPASFLLGWI